MAALRDSLMSALIFVLVIASSTIQNGPAVVGGGATDRGVLAHEPFTDEGATVDFVWIRQFGTPGADEASSVALDASGMYVAWNSQRYRGEIGRAHV